MILQPLLPDDRAKIVALFRELHPTCPLLTPAVSASATGEHVTVTCPCKYETKLRHFELDEL